MVHLYLLYQEILFPIIAVIFRQEILFSHKKKIVWIWRSAKNIVFMMVSLPDD